MSTGSNCIGDFVFIKIAVLLGEEENHSEWTTDDRIECLLEFKTTFFSSDEGHTL